MTQIRGRLKRNFLAMLALSQGVPMLSHGDEIGRTQQGNNNAYCLDNEISWIDWQLGEPERALLEFTAMVLGVRRSNPVLHRRHFLRGTATPSGVKDVLWLRPDGQEMTEGD